MFYVTIDIDSAYVSVCLCVFSFPWDLGYRDSVPRCPRDSLTFFGRRG